MRRPDLFLSFIQMSCQALTFDVLVNVADFLAGDYAFRTLAALNQVNHPVKDGPSSVLYETLFFDMLFKSVCELPIKLQKESAGQSPSGFWVWLVPG